MTTGDVHVGDVGTTYQAEIQDAGIAFDPSSAIVKTLIFRSPSGVLTRNATITTVDGAWFLTYTTVAGIDDAFHARAGIYRWQGRVTFADGQQYSTNEETYIVRGNLS